MGQWNIHGECGDENTNMMMGKRVFRHATVFQESNLDMSQDAMIKKSETSSTGIQIGLKQQEELKWKYVGPEPSTLEVCVNIRVSYELS
ncbi:hypothetical protein JTB14_014967 [Gonioctena quinquepunctata]|nr:hypothetical protein JTB14_014967 [Gonioctena quinquepunctata]